MLAEGYNLLNFWQSFSGSYTLNNFDSTSENQFKSNGQTIGIATIELAPKFRLAFA